MSRVALVTGAAGGIGAAIVSKLEDDGWSVHGVDVADADLTTREGNRAVLDLNTRGEFRLRAHKGKVARQDQSSDPLVIEPDAVPVSCVAFPILVPAVANATAPVAEPPVAADAPAAGPSRLFPATANATPATMTSLRMWR